LYPFGPDKVGFGFLATTRRDGGPRVHPLCPAVFEGGLYVAVVEHSPKRFDLERDGRFALHGMPGMEDDESFYCAGRARALDPSLREGMLRGFAHCVKPYELLFELYLERALHTTWLHPRTPATKPVHERWRAS
jgi:hypothetical protein